MSQFGPATLSACGEGASICLIGGLFLTPYFKTAGHALAWGEFAAGFVQVAWMMGSWGARLTVQSLYARTSDLPFRTSYFALLTSMVLFSTPALFASSNPEASLAPLELAAAIVWLLAFAERFGLI